MTSKNLNKWLRQQSALLPEETYDAFHKYNVPIVKNIAPEGEDEKLQLISGEIEKHPVNHYRRLKTLFNSNGWDGVNKYFQDRGFALIDEREK